MALSLRHPDYRLEGAITSHLEVIVSPAHAACGETPAPQGKAKRVPERQKQQMRERGTRVAQSGMQQGPRGGGNREHGERAWCAGGEQAPEGGHGYPERNEAKSVANRANCAN